MKYLKHFEYNEDPPYINDGDYVLFYYSETENYAYHIGLDTKLKEFINNNIGYVITSSSINNEWINVQYDNIPKDIVYKFNKGNEVLLTKHNILEVAKTKEELEMTLSANKYNL